MRSFFITSNRECRWTFKQICVFLPFFLLKTFLAKHKLSSRWFSLGVPEVSDDRSNPKWYQKPQRHIRKKIHFTKNNYPRRIWKELFFGLSWDHQWRSRINFSGVEMRKILALKAIKTREIHLLRWWKSKYCF